MSGPVFAPSIASLWRYWPHARLSVSVLTAYNIALGVVLMVGDPARVSTASFATIRSLGGPLTCGLMLAALGVAIPAAALVSRRAVAYVFGLGAVAHLFLAAGFVVAALDRPDAALTGPFTYITISAWHGVQCLVHRQTASPTS